MRHRANRPSSVAVNETTQKHYYNKDDSYNNNNYKNNRSRSEEDNRDNKNNRSRWVLLSLAAFCSLLILYGVREGLVDDAFEAMAWMRRRRQQKRLKRESGGGGGGMHDEKEEDSEEDELRRKEMSEIDDSVSDIDLNALAAEISAHRAPLGVSFGEVATRFRDSLPDVRIDNIRAKNVMERALNLDDVETEAEQQRRGLNRIQLVIGAEGCGKNSALKQLLLERLESGDERATKSNVIYLDLFDLDDPKDMLPLMKSALNVGNNNNDDGMMRLWTQELQALDGPRLRRLIGKLTRLAKDKNEKYTVVVENAHRLTQFLDRHRYQYQIYWDDEPAIEQDRQQQQQSTHHKQQMQQQQQQQKRHKSGEFKEAYKIASNWILWLNELAKNSNVHIVMLTHESSTKHQLARLPELRTDRFPTTHVVPVFDDMETMKRYCLHRLMSTYHGNKPPRGSDEFAAEIVARLGGLFRDYDLIFRSRDVRRNLQELMKQSREKFLPLLQVPKDSSPISPSRDILNQKVVRLWRFCKKIDNSPAGEMTYDRAAEILTVPFLTKLIDENIVHYSNFGKVSLLPRYRFLVRKKISQDPQFVEKMNYLAQKHVTVVK